MNHRSVPVIPGQQSHHHTSQNKIRSSSVPGRYLHMLFFLITVLYTHSVFAQWSNDPGVNTAVSTLAASTTSPAIIASDKGSVIIAWSENWNGNNNTNIFVQRLNADGLPEWKINGQAVTSGAVVQSGPYIVTDGSGGVIIAWNDQRDGIDADIYAQHVSASGQVTWSTSGVPVCKAEKGQGITSMIADGKGGAIIAWGDYRNGVYSNIYIQHISASGAIKWNPNGLAVCPQPNFQHFPALLINSEGNTIVTWEDSRNGFLNIYAQMIGDDGKTKWPTGGLPVYTAGHKNFLPTIISDGEDGAIIAWLDYRRDDRSDIYAQKINKEGLVKWPSGGVEIGRAVGWQRGPQMVSDNAGGAIVTWDDYRSGSNANPNTYAQRVNREGIVEWTQYGVAVCPTATRQYWSSVVSDSAGGAIITWKDNRYGNPGDIYAQHLNAAGVHSWNNNGVIISSAQNGQAFPAIVSINKQGAVIAWRDERNDNDGIENDYEIYAQNINLGGKIGCFTPVITDQPLETQRAWQGTTAADLMVKATGHELKYQWFSNTTASTNSAKSLFPAGTEALFTPATAKEGTLYYYCMVTSKCDTLYSALAKVMVEVPVTALQIKLSPNPTESFFSMTVTSPGNQTLHVRMFDMLGRLVEYQQGARGQLLKLGERLATGMYLIEVRQAEEVIVIKAVKQ